jgi:hypothetical protein
MSISQKGFGMGFKTLEKEAIEPLSLVLQDKTILFLVQDKL